MMNHQRGITGYGEVENARPAARRMTTSSGQSGVYDKVASQSATALPSFWRDDADDQDDEVPLPQASGPTTLSTLVQFQPPKREMWQVALLLRGEELTRLWRRNASHLAGRVFVWSEHASDWVQLQGSPEPSSMYQQPQPLTGSSWRNPAAIGANPLPAYTSPYAELRPVVQASGPVDLSEQARSLSGFVGRRWAIGLAASLLALAAVTLWLQRKPQPTETPLQGVAQQRPLETAPQGASKPDIIPVNALPLVRSNANREVQKQVTTVSPAKVWLESTPTPTPKVTAAPVVAATKAFDPTVARQALSRAAWQAGHCASSDISGTVLVTYDPSGAVQDVSLSGLVGDPSRTQCIVSAFHTARIAPFQGNRVTVRKSFSRRGGV